MRLLDKNSMENVNQSSHLPAVQVLFLAVFKHNNGNCSLTVKHLVVIQADAGSNPVGYPAVPWFHSTTPKGVFHDGFPGPPTPNAGP
jgi:hypothetical protein